MAMYAECKLSVPGFHKWDGADEDVSYLASRHRHDFNIKALFSVTNNNRQIEIIQSENEIRCWLMRTYGIKELGTRAGYVMECDFKGMSCEDIAEEIGKTFGADFVEVLEDGGGGAVYVSR